MVFVSGFGAFFKQINFTKYLVSFNLHSSTYFTLKITILEVNQNDLVKKMSIVIFLV